MDRNYAVYVATYINIYIFNMEMHEFTQKYSLPYMDREPIVTITYKFKKWYTNNNYL